MRSFTPKIIALIGILLLVASLVFPWVDGMHARDIPLQRLLSAGSVHPVSEVAQSIAALLALAAFAGGVSLLLSRKNIQRILLCLSVLISLTVTVLWGTMEAIYKAPANFTAVDIQFGAWAACAGVLVLLASCILSFRQPKQPAQ